MPPITEPQIRARGTVRVSLPAKIAYDPDALKKSLTSILDKLGCSRCFSGANCYLPARTGLCRRSGGAGGVESATVASARGPCGCLARADPIVMTSIRSSDRLMP